MEPKPPPMGIHPAPCSSFTPREASQGTICKICAWHRDKHQGKPK